MAKSLQQIDDYYQSLVLKGDALRKALENDKEYQSLLRAKKSVIRKKFGITKEEEKQYLLPNQEDYEILSMIKALQNKNLSLEDKEMVELIRTQLKLVWRSPLISKLRSLSKKYR